jgi:hypothetical protein
MRQKVLVLDHPDTLTSVTNLASIYWNHGRWKEVEDQHVQVDAQSAYCLGVSMRFMLGLLSGLMITV